MQVVFQAFIILLCQVSWSWGQIYKWIDNDGKAHFTDNAAMVPEVYRNPSKTPAVKETSSTYTSSHQVQSQANLTAAPSHSGGSTRPFVVPLKRAGNALFVQATLNGFVRAPLIVDTGASLTVISTHTAQRLGLDLDRAAMIAMRSVSGMFLAYLTKVRSMKIGDAIVKDVEVVVHDISPGREQGLLGMSFLDHFNVTIHTLQDIMHLKPLDQVAGASLYGGKPQSWWQHKFRFYRQQVSLIDDYLDDRSSPQLEQSRRYFQNELAVLERRARLASVPRSWRY